MLPNYELGSSITINQDDQPNLYKLAVQVQASTQKTIWDVISDSFNKTFPNDSTNASYDEFNGLTPAEMLKALTFQQDYIHNRINEKQYGECDVKLECEEDYNALKNLVDATLKIIMSSDNIKYDPVAINEALQKAIRKRIKQHNDTLLMQLTSLVGFPNRVKFHEIGNTLEIWKRIGKNFLSIQDNARPEVKGLNAFLAITLITPAIKIAIAALKCARNIAKSCTQFLFCVIADVSDSYITEQCSNQNPGTALLLKCIKYTARLIELFFKSGLDPWRGVKDSWKLGFEVANTVDESGKITIERPLAGYTLAILFCILDIASAIAFTLLTFGLFAKLSGIDIASHIPAELVARWADMPVISQLGHFLTNALASIGITLPAEATAITAFIAIGEGLLFKPISAAFHRLYEILEHHLEVYSQAPQPPFLVGYDGYGNTNSRLSQEFEMPGSDNNYENPIVVSSIDDDYDNALTQSKSNYYVPTNDSDEGCLSSCFNSNSRRY